MNRLTTIILAIALSLIPLTAFALWNCELEVANDGNTNDELSSENDTWNYDPCVVGTFDKDWLGKQGLSDDKYNYYNDCRSIKSIADKIQEDDGICYIGEMTGNPFSLILFQTEGFGDPNFSSECDGDNEGECLWKKHAGKNGGSQTITDTVTIGKEGEPRTIAIAGYNVFMPTDGGDHYTCMGDPEDEGSCDYFANDCKGGSFGPMCPDRWESRLIENEVTLESLGSNYSEESPINPANWNKGNGEVTIFAGNRATCGLDTPCGSYSKIIVDVGSGKSAFVVEAGSLLVLRDIRIVIKSGQAIRIKKGAEASLVNVVIYYDDNNASPETAVSVDNGGHVHLIDPNEFTTNSKLKSNYTDFGYYQFGIARFIVPDSLKPKLDADFSYIKLGNSSGLKLSNTNDNPGFNVPWLANIFDLSSELPSNNVPVRGQKNAICEVTIDSSANSNVSCKKENGSPISFKDKNCLLIGNDSGFMEYYDIHSTKFPAKITAEQNSELDSLFICDNYTISIKPVCSSGSYLTKKAFEYSCSQPPTNGNAWMYDDTSFKFVCTGKKIQNGSCIDCPYGMDASFSENKCVCEDGKISHTASYSYTDDAGTTTVKKIGICYAQCPEGKINEIDTLTGLALSAPKGQTIYNLNKLFKETDNCSCPKGQTDSTMGCIDAPALQNECLAKNASAVHGSYSWKGTDYSCEFNCKDGFFETAEGACSIKCNGSGKVAANDGNSCVCNTAQHWVNDGTGCKCDYANGYTLKNGACAIDDNPPECSEDSDCDDDELCDDGECVDIDGPKKGFGESCKESSECNSSKGLACSDETCYCDSDNNWTINTVTGNSCIKGKPKDDDEKICKINGGTYIKKETYCEFNATIAACKSSGRTWNKTDQSCSTGGGDSGGESGTAGGCASVSSASLPESVGSVLPYLLLLGYVSLRGVRQRQMTKQSR